MGWCVWGSVTWIGEKMCVSEVFLGGGLWCTVQVLFAWSSFFCFFFFFSKCSHAPQATFARVLPPSPQTLREAKHTSISKKFSGIPYISSKLCVCGFAPVLAKPVGMNCCAWPWPCCCCWACDCCGGLVLEDCEGCSGRGSMRCILGEVVVGVRYRCPRGCCC